MDIQAKDIRYYGDKLLGVITLEKLTATDNIQVGDFLKLTTGKVEKVTAATDDATFVGIALTRSDDADGPQYIEVLMEGMIVVPATAAAYNFGDPLTVDPSTGTVVTDGGVNTFCHAWETAPAGTTELKVKIDVDDLQKLFAVNA